VEGGKERMSKEKRKRYKDEGRVISKEEVRTMKRDPKRRTMRKDMKKKLGKKWLKRRMKEKRR